MLIENSNLPFNYICIRTTQSRIDKKLLAIPANLSDRFSQNINKICVLDENDREIFKAFTPYKSTSKECRIGGMGEFYKKFEIKADDEIVIIFYAKDKIKILPERYFLKHIKQDLKTLETSNNGDEFTKALNHLSKNINIDKMQILKNQFVFNARQIIKVRKRKSVKNLQKREAVPIHMRNILLSLYNGKCQVSGWTFQMQNLKPYFEIHHIDATKGNHFKNLLVVCPNIHAQFTYANLKQVFDREGWLREVYFNGERHEVFQIIDFIKQDFTKEIYF